MKTLTPGLRLGLEDLLGDLWHARRSGDLGRLALVSYYEVRRWAKLAGVVLLAEHAAQVLKRSPHSDRDSFLADVDRVIAELEALRSQAAECGEQGADLGLERGPGRLALVPVRAADPRH